MERGRTAGATSGIKEVTMERILFIIGMTLVISFLAVFIGTEIWMGIRDRRDEKAHRLRTGYK